MEEFIFDSLTLDDLVKYVDTSKVFNITKGEFNQVKVYLASYEDEKLGSAVERLDVAYHIGNKWSLVDMTKVEGFNEVPLSWLLSDVGDIDDCLVILRRMSNMVLDKNNSSLSTYIYHIVDDKYEFITSNALMNGKLARYGIMLDGSIDDILESIDTKVDNDYDKNSLISFIKSGVANESDMLELVQLGKNVRYIRVNVLETTISEFSNLTGISRDVVCRIEDLRMGKGSKTCPSVSTILKLCKSLNIEIGDIMGNDISFNEDALLNLKEVVSCGN